MTSRLLAQVHNVNVSVRQSFCDSRQEREVKLPPSLRDEWATSSQNKGVHEIAATKFLSKRCENSLLKATMWKNEMHSLLSEIIPHLPEVRHKELFKERYILPASAEIFVWEMPK
jgi:hypothetical protein